MLIILWLSLIFSHVHRGLAQSNDYFINPPQAGQLLFFAENDVYPIGSNVNVQWIAEESQYTIWLWQQSLTVGSAALGEPVFIAAKILGSPQQYAFNWSATPQLFDLNQSSVFFFALGTSSSITANTTTSHYFNITGNSQIITTTSPTQSTISTSAVRTATSAATANAATITPGANEKNSSQSNKSTISVGIGLGVGLGLPLLITLALLTSKYLLRHNIVPRNYFHTYATPLRQGCEQDRSISPQEVAASDQFSYHQGFRESKPSYLNEVPVELPVEGNGTYVDLDCR